MSNLEPVSITSNRAGAKACEPGGLGDTDALGQPDAGAFDLLRLTTRPVACGS